MGGYVKARKDVHAAMGASDIQPQPRVDALQVEDVGAREGADLEGGDGGWGMGEGEGE